VQKRLYQHEVAVLDKVPARQLFRRAAGLEGGLAASLCGLEEEMLRICGGLPLALQLLGGQLFEDTTVASWQVMACAHCLVGAMLHSEWPGWAVGTARFTPGHATCNRVSQGAMDMPSAPAVMA
jgi:hypothetical protein